MRTHHKRFLRSYLPLTRENNFQILAEKSLTLFPDVIRSPLWKAGAVPVGTRMLSVADGSR